VATDINARRSIRDTPFWRAYHESRYAILFYALLLTLLVMPVAVSIGLPSILVKILIGGCLCAAVLPNATRRNRQLLLGAVVVLIITRIAADYGDLPVNPGVPIAIVGALGLVTAAKALQYAVRTKTVGSETLYAALSTYLIAGVFFGQIYWSVEEIWPGSLVGPDPLTESRALYYSFVTLATLGYGDYLPRTDIARGLAVFEVIGGQLFLAVMVARLIGLFAPGRRDS
jgi:Ion channel